MPECYPEPVQSGMEPRAIKEVSVPTASPATREQLINEFPTVFDGTIRTMPGEIFKIVLTADAKPFCVNTPRTLPYAFMGPTKEELDLLESQGIIAKQTEPTDWCAPVVVTRKKNSDKIRLCVDLSHLNKYVKRERFQSTPPAIAVANIAASKAKYFTVFDAYKGYHQCPLDPESQKLTTFITPHGRYRFLRAPYGLSSISEHYDRRMYEAFQDLQDYRRIVDDVVIYDGDKDTHTEHVRQFLHRCEERGISLNKDKFQFCQEHVEFAGFNLSEDGYKVSSDITKAIADFPSPATRTDLRSFFGLVNQLSGSSSQIANVMAPLRPLLQSKNEFLWDANQESTFKTAKKTLVSSPTLTYFDGEAPTRLVTDASRLGLGFVLQQQHQGDWKLVQAGSRFLTDTESRYAVIELELLGVAWAAKKCRIFLTGLPHFTVVTDHNPLVPILNSHRLDEIENPRLQRLRTHLLAFNFTAQWRKGKDNDAADALSRHPSTHPTPGEDLAEHDLDTTQTLAVVQCAPLVDVRAMASPNLRIEGVLEAAREDQEYQDVLQLVQNGFPPAKSHLPDRLKKFWGARVHLSVDDGCLVYGCRLFIPSQLRPDVLSKLHEGHPGVTRAKDRARLTVYWPGIDMDIEQATLDCKLCQDSLPSHPPEPIKSKPRPERPFQEVAVDFAYHGGQHFLISVDCFSDWPDIHQMGKNTTAPSTIRALRALFCRTSAPDKLWSDCGPPFTSKPVQDFLSDWGIKHATSSPTYPQSNGKAEATVKAMKKLIKASWLRQTVDEDRLFRGLMQYRNTPSRRDGQSPAQKLYGCPVQDSLPAHRRSFAPDWQRAPDPEQVEEKLDQAEKYYDQRAHPLPDLHVGSKVAIQDSTTKVWDIYGTIVAHEGRRYFVRTGSGRVLVRNRRFLRKRTPMSFYAPRDRPDQAQDQVQDPVAPQAPRRFRRQRRRPKRLIEDPDWP